MHLLVINQPLNNRGDESAHKALIRSLLSSLDNVKITVLFVDCYSPYGMDQFAIKAPNISYINLHSVRGFKRCGTNVLKTNHYFWWKIHPTMRRLISIYNSVDAVICAPGGICMGGFQDWNHLFFLKIAKYTKKPLIYYGRSFGPFPTITENNRLFKKLSQEMLDYFSFLAIREKKTEQLANEMGYSYYSTVDTAFLDSPIVQIPYEIRQAIGNRPYMVFVPNILIWHYKYRDINLETIYSFYIEITRTILSQYGNFNIVMLPQTFGTGAPIKDDVFFFRDIAERLNDNRIIVIPDCYSSDVQQRIIHNSRFVVGARYHSIVFSINQGVPFIALSYEHKIVGLVESLGMANRVIDLTNAFESDDSLKRKYDEFETLLSSCIKDVSEFTTKAKDNSSACFNRLLQVLTTL